MERMMREQEATANNLANANTSGYKKGRIFTTALNERLDAEAAPRSDRQVDQAPDLSQGALRNTGNPLDVALNGKGFFVLRDRDTGTQKFTRAGHFITGPNGQLQTPSGDTVQSEGGPLQVPPNTAKIDISQTGVVMADGQRIGKMRTVQFNNPGQLVRLDGASFRAAGQQPQPAENVQVVQGHLEGSNVSPVQAMTDMIEHFRAFEMQQRSIRTTDSILRGATRDLGSL